MVTPEQRYWEKVIQNPQGCWGWRGAPNSKGYGTVSVAGKVMGAHRFSYELHNGPVPAGLWVLHRCDNPPCTRPDHLFLGTPSDNALDCSAKGRANGAARAHHGEDHGRAKLSWEIVREIRKRHPEPPGRRARHRGPFLIDTAREFGITSGHVSAIVAGRSWPEEVMPNV